MLLRAINLRALHKCHLIRWRAQCASHGAFGTFSCRDTSESVQRPSNCGQISAVDRCGNRAVDRVNFVVLALVYVVIGRKVCLLSSRA